MSVEDGFTPSPAISPEAADFFRKTFSRKARDGLFYPAPNDVNGWREYNVLALAERVADNAALRERFRADLRTATIGGVEVLDIRPLGWRKENKVVVYTHGGAFVGGTAEDALDSTLPIATEARLRIVSINYTLAPHAKFTQITDETVAVVRGLRDMGFQSKDIAILGDSAGGGLAAATALKYRDLHRELIACVALWSPWCDLSGSGDTYATLAAEEPFYTYKDHLLKGALAYAGPDQLRHPYASPLFADFLPGYPPTLIQVGTRELLLSDSVRLCQALRAANQPVSLDVYDGMWHVFQFKPIDSPEAMLARKRTVDFLLLHLGADREDHVPRYRSPS